MAVAISRGFIGIPLARHAFPRNLRSSSLFLHPAFSCAPSRPLGTRLSAIAMTTVAPDSASPPMTASEKEEFEFWQQVTIHQKTAERLSAIEEARIVVDQCPNGFLSTFSQRFEGFPYVSFVDYAADEDGSLIISVSSLAPHTKVPEPWVKKARDVFLSKHPDAFWVDFGDFKFMRIDPTKIRFASGIVSPFNRTGEFSGEEFRDAKLDSIAQFSIPIATHMNRDHADETKRLVEKAIECKVESATIVDLDTRGLNVQVIFQGKPIKLRVAFPRPAQDRKDVKNLIVQMLGG